MLIIFSGLPATGKTTLARELVRRTGGIHLRVDSIEQAIRETGHLNGEEGYRVACAVAADNLRLGCTVIADSANLLQETRDAWVKVAKVESKPFLEIEVQCSEMREHQRRIETRITDVPGLRLPTWQEVRAREHHPWDREHLVIDTASYGVAESVDRICEALDALTHLGC